MGSDPSLKNKTIILFDGICNLCNGAVNFVIDHDPRQRFLFASLQSSAGRQMADHNGLDQDTINTIVLLDKGKVYQKSDAVLNVFRMMPGLWPLLAVFFIIPRLLRDGVYSWIARNRYKWFGKQDHCRIPAKELGVRFLDS